MKPRRAGLPQASPPRCRSLARRLKVSLLAIAVATAPFAISDTENDTPLHIRHPYNVAGDQIYARRTLYLVELLDLAMSHSGHPYTLEKVPLATVTANRNTRNLHSGLYDVNWMHTNHEREEELLPVRIPLFRGLTGWRIMLIRPETQPRFMTIDSLDELKQLTAGQGHDWPDTRVLRAHHFKLVTSSSRDSLVNMVTGHRVDYFPRSLMEVWDELDVYQPLGLTVESELLLVYPTAYYFFVPRDNPQLASLLDRGLNAAVADGSFTDLFDRYYADKIAKAHLHSRRRFNLTNPDLSAATPLGRKELWFEP